VTSPGTIISLTHGLMTLYDQHIKQLECMRVMGLYKVEEKSSTTFPFSLSPGFLNFSSKGFLLFCMGHFKKTATYVSLSFSPGFLSFLREEFYLFSSTLGL